MMRKELDNEMNERHSRNRHAVSNLKADYVFTSSGSLFSLPSTRFPSLCRHRQSFLSIVSTPYPPLTSWIRLSWGDQSPWMDSHFHSINEADTTLEASHSLLLFTKIEVMYKIQPESRSSKVWVKKNKMSEKNSKGMSANCCHVKRDISV